MPADFTGELSAKKQRKLAFRNKLDRFLEEYENIFILCIDNVGSNQMQQVRQSLRGEAELLMGKNTIIRMVVTEAAAKNPKLEPLIPYIKGNMGFCFTNGDLPSLRKKIIENQVPAAAKSGGFAPVSVTIPTGPTGLDPGQTAFFQAMNIATKISRGTIEIVTEVQLIKEGDRVSSSAVALLSKLGIRPFFFGIQVTHVYENGSFYDAKVMDLTDDDLKNKFFAGVRHVAAISLALHYPTAASLPHLILNAFGHLVAVSLETDYTFEESQRFKDYLANPDAFAAAAPAGGAAAAPAPEPEPEEEEEEMDFDLFG
jgi:large subunit ribosomal protein LP0